MYYVYAYIDPRDSVPFYIGRGQRKRDRQHLRPHCLKKDTFFYKKLRKLLSLGIQPDIRRISEGLSDSEANTLETLFILAIGRRTNPNNPGPLCNLTDGGEGSVGYKPTEEHRRKLSNANKGSLPTTSGRPLTPEHRNKLSRALTGRKHSAETRAKISDAAKLRRGRPVSPNTRAKLSAAVKRARSANPGA